MTTATRFILFSNRTHQWRRLYRRSTFCSWESLSATGLHKDVQNGDYTLISESHWSQIDVNRRYLHGWCCVELLQPRQTLSAQQLQQRRRRKKKGFTSFQIDLGSLSFWRLDNATDELCGAFVCFLFSLQLLQKLSCFSVQLQNGFVDYEDFTWTNLQ